MPRYSPHQGEFRINGQRYAFYKKGGLFGSTFTANGVSASSERELKKKLAAKKTTKQPQKKKPGWFG